MPWMCQRLNAPTCSQSGSSKRGISRIGVRLQPVTLCVCHSMCGCAIRIQRAPAPYTLALCRLIHLHRHPLRIRVQRACDLVHPKREHPLVQTTLCSLEGVQCKCIWSLCQRSHARRIIESVQVSLSLPPYVLQFFRLQRVVVSLVPLHTQHKPSTPNGKQGGRCDRLDHSDTTTRPVDIDRPCHSRAQVTSSSFDHGHHASFRALGTPRT